jgi:hypothetical protein
VARAASASRIDENASPLVVNNDERRFLFRAFYDSSRESATPRER